MQSSILFNITAKTKTLWRRRVVYMYDSGIVTFSPLHLRQQHYCIVFTKAIINNLAIGHTTGRNWSIYYVGIVTSAPLQL